MFIRIKLRKGILRTRLCAKLAPIYVGPFEVLVKVGSVYYQLGLPPNIRIHDVFHVSLLNKYIVDKTHIIAWKNV